MANPYNKGETVICWRNVKTAAGEYYDPATSMKITITDSHNGVKVDNVDMTGGEPPAEDKGRYYYDYHTDAANRAGKYTVIYTATDGTRVTIEKDEFELD